MERPNNKTCAFTGHRPQKLPWRYNEDDERCLAVKEILRTHIMTLVTEKNVTKFLSGMALGIDMICAEIVLELAQTSPGVSLRCVVPFLKQDEAWSPALRTRYRRILEQSGDIVIINDEYTDDCIRDRNKYLAQHADYLIAAVSNWKSGTGATVSFARKAGAEIILIDLGAPPRTPIKGCRP